MHALLHKPRIPSRLNSGFNRNSFLLLSLLLLSLAAAMLYWFQHNDVLSGGAIAPSKLAWLLVVIMYWYVLPIYWLLGNGLNRQAKLALQVFLVSMILRAVVELTMMYLTQNWLHAYGIAHNLFSIALCTVIGLYLLRLRTIISWYFVYSAVMFIVETYFAQYLQSVSNADGNVFFLESVAEHSHILWLTQIAVIVSMLVFLTLIARQTVDTTKR